MDYAYRTSMRLNYLLFPCHHCYILPLFHSHCHTDVALVLAPLCDSLPNLILARYSWYRREGFCGSTDPVPWLDANGIQVICGRYAAVLRLVLF